MNQVFSLLPTQFPNSLPQKNSLFSPIINNLPQYNAAFYLHPSRLRFLQHEQQLAILKTHKTPFSAFDREQKLLEHLFEVHPTCSERDKIIILNLCSSLRIQASKDCHSVSAEQIDSVLDKCKQQIAKIIHLADQNPSQLASIIDLDQIQATYSKIQNLFDHELKKTVVSIENLKNQHEGVPIQDASLATSVNKPLAISKLLITSSGHLNLGLIDSIKKNFFDHSQELIRYEKELLQSLDDIEHSSTLQEQVEGAKKPNSGYLSSNDLIRITLKLSPSSSPTDVHAKIVALAAILSDFLQGNDNNCFAASIAIHPMSSLKNKIITDINQLLSEGLIYREKGFEQSDFAPVLEIRDTAFRTPFKINKDGAVFIGKHSGYLWQSPGIIAACRQLNIQESDVEPVIKNILDQHYALNKFKPNALSEISPQEVITYLVERVCGAHSVHRFTPSQNRELYNLASFAFCSETNTPILRAWESCTISMMDSPHNHLMRGKILNCILSAFDSLWPKSYFFGLTEQAKQVQQLVRTQLNKTIQLRYNLHSEIKTKEPFLLHELTHGVKSISAKSIQTPSELKQFVSNKILLSKEEIEQSQDKNRNKLLEIIDKIQKNLGKPDHHFSSFLNKAIRAYHEDNSKIQDPLKSWETINHPPFREAAIAPSTSFIIRPKNALELLNAFILFGRSQAGADSFLKDSNLYPHDIDYPLQHSFTLTPEDPSVIDAISSPMTPTRWIEEQLVKTGNAVANRILSAEQRINFINYVCSKMIPAELSTSFKNHASFIPSSACTLHLYSNAILDILLKMTKRKNSKTRAEWSRNLTNIILNLLFPQETFLIKKNATRIVNIGDLDQGVKHISLTCFFDPLTKTLQLGSQVEGGDYLQALDQDEWVYCIPWELYGVKFNPTLDDRIFKHLEV